MTEETAWRGFALPRLQSRYSALNASLILGILWGIWHLPLWFIPDSFQSTLPFGGFVLATVAMSIITTWVFNHTHGSVLLAAILHAATDVTLAYSNVLSGDLRLFWIFVVLQSVFAIFIVITLGAEHFSKNSDLRGTTVEYE
ncbi:MAG: CPBP family intramembrane metalloprotease [Caldilineaceae bacterium]|nr:CPBP family intramembrane metalloprotease [Caldilineaceae bacterium]